MTAPQPAATKPEVLFVSPRLTALRCVTLAAWAPLPLVVWLISLAPRTEWDEHLGRVWWVGPAGLIGLAVVMPAAVLWLHGRYVLRLEREGDVLRLTTFQLWGVSQRELSVATLATAELDFDEGRASYGRGPLVNAPSLQARWPDGRRLIFDASGEAPAGWSTLYTLFRR